MNRKILTLITVPLVALSLVYATVFSHRHFSGILNIADIKLVEITSPHYPLCIGITRTTRTALVYTDFESHPTEWISNGGTWSITTGYKGGALQGVDNNAGTGYASHYYYNSDLSTHSSLWISVKTRHVSGSGWYGLSLFNRRRDRFYTVEVYTDGNIEVWSWNVESEGWYRLARALIQNYSLVNWYIIVVNYNVTRTAVNFYVWVYDTSGNQVGYVNASSTSRRRFRPAYIGVEVDDVSALFEDFIISTSDPRFISLIDLPGSGYGVAVFDNLGNLINTTVSTETTLVLGIIPDIVTGTGVNGRIIVLYPNNLECLIYITPSSDVILGGDVYRVLWRTVNVDPVNKHVYAYIGYGSNLTKGALFNISIYPAEIRYTYLKLDITDSTIPNTLNLNISLVNAIGMASSSIQIISGVVVNDTTTIIALQGTENYVLIEGYFTQPTQTAKLKLYIIACSSPTAETCIIITTITLYLNTIE
jgi:hypothetical protein